MGGFDELIERLLHDVALAGTEGLTASQFERAVRAFYDAANSDAGDGVPLSGDELLFSEAPPGKKITIDDSLFDSVLEWLQKDPDVNVREVEQSDSDRVDNRDQVRSIDAPSQSRLIGKRIFTSEERIWHAIAGHGIDPKRIPPMEFEILSVIAARGPSGILQPSVTKITGQDKRSVPKRTDALAEKGYISKQHVIGTGTKTSILKLKRYETVQPVQSVEPDVAVETGLTTGSDAEASSPVIYYDAWFDDTIRLLKENNNTLALNDLRIHLGIAAHRTSVRALYRCICRLADSGCIRRITAKYQDSQGRNLIVLGTSTTERSTRAIQLLREPNEFDRLQWMAKSAQGKKLQRDTFSDDGADDMAADEAVLPENADTDDADDPTADSDMLKDRIPPQWTPEIPMTNMIYSVVENAGQRGINSVELTARLTGPLFRRPLDEATNRLTDAWQSSQPPHLRHLSIVRDTAVHQRKAVFQYRTLPNFDKATIAGETVREAIIGGKAVGKKKLIYPELDEWGFPNVPLKDLAGGDGRASLAAARKSFEDKPTDEERTTFDPRNLQLQESEAEEEYEPPVGLKPSQRAPDRRKRKRPSVVTDTSSPLSLDEDTPAETPRNKRGPYRKRLLTDRPPPVFKKREVLQEELEAWEEAAQAAAERRVMIEVKANRKRTAAEAGRDESLPESLLGVERSIRDESVLLDELPQDRIAQVKADLVARQKPGIYFNPPGARALKLQHRVTLGRPRAMLIGVVKSERLKDLPWFQEEERRYAPPPTKRRRTIPAPSTDNEAPTSSTQISSTQEQPVEAPHGDMNTEAAVLLSSMELLEPIDQPNGFTPVVPTANTSLNAASVPVQNRVDLVPQAVVTSQSSAPSTTLTETGSKSYVLPGAPGQDGASGMSFSPSLPLSQSSASSPLVQKPHQLSSTLVDAKTELQALRSRRGRRSKATLTRISELMDLLSGDDTTLMVKLPVSAFMQNSAGSKPPPKSDTGMLKWFDKAYVDAHPNEEFHHRGSGRYARGPRTIMPHPRGAEAQAAADARVLKILKDRQTSIDPQQVLPTAPVTGVASMSSSTAVTQGNLFAKADTFPNRPQTNMSAAANNGAGESSDRATNQSIAASTALDRPYSASFGSSYPSELSSRVSKPQPHSNPNQETNNFFDSAYVSNHPNETFHHRGYGRWIPGLPPPEFKTRSVGVRGPGAAEWIASNLPPDRHSASVAMDTGVPRQPRSLLPKVPNAVTTQSRSSLGQTSLSTSSQNSKSVTNSFGGVSNSRDPTLSIAPTVQEAQPASASILNGRDTPTSSPPLQMVRPYMKTPSQHSSSKVTETLWFPNDKTSSLWLRNDSNSVTASRPQNDSSRMPIERMARESPEVTLDLANEAMEMPEITVAVPVERNVASSEASQKTSKRGRIGDSVLAQRQKVILDAIRACNGVFPGNQEPWVVSISVWLRVHKQKPDRHTIDNLVKDMVDSGKLTKFSFQFLAKTGVHVTRYILADPDMDPSMSVVKMMQKNIMDAHPVPYFPPEADITVEIRRSWEKKFRVGEPEVPKLPLGQRQAFTTEAGLVVQQTLLAEKERKAFAMDLMKTGRGKLAEDDFEQTDEDDDDNDEEEISPEQASMQSEFQLDNYWHDLNAAYVARARWHPRLGRRVHFDNLLQRKLPSSTINLPRRPMMLMRRPMSALRTVFRQHPSRDFDGGMSLDDFARHRRQAVSLLLHPAQHLHEATGTFGTSGVIDEQALLDGVYPFGFDLEVKHTPTAFEALTGTGKTSIAKPRRKYRTRVKFASRDSDMELTPGTEQSPQRGAKARYAAALAEDRQNSGRERRSPSVFKDGNRLVVAYALINTVCGGVNQDRMNWTLVAHAMGFRYEADFLRRRWGAMRVTRKPDVERLRKFLREPFLQAYEQDKLPRIDFQNLNQTDWPAFFKWAEDVTGTTPRADLCDVPDLCETREEMEKLYSVQEPLSLFELNRDDYFNTVTDSQRKHLSLRYNNSAAMSNPSNLKDGMMLAKSWARAVTMTKNSNYDPKAAAAKLKPLGEKILGKVSAEMLKNRMFCQERKGRHWPGRNYQIHNDVLAPFKRWPSKSHEFQFLRAVGQTWSYINKHFQSNDELRLVPAASDPEYLVFENLAAHGILKMKSDLPDIKDDYDAPAPRLSPWGYGPPGYETRKVDASILKFPIIFVKTAAYPPHHELNLNVPIPLHAPIVPDELGQRIPFWTDIHGNLIDDVWDMVLRSLIHLVVFRPGISAESMQQSHNHKFWAWEIELALGWMEEVGIASRAGCGAVVDGVWKGGWTAEKWWFCAFAPDVAVWKAPMEFDVGVQTSS